MPGIIPPGIPPFDGFSSFSFAIATSVVNKTEDTEIAFCNADLVTFAGSIIPAFIISTYSSFAASYPIPCFAFLTYSITTPASTPEFTTICLNGEYNAFLTISTPNPSSPSNLKFSIAFAI